MGDEALRADTGGGIRHFVPIRDVGCGMRHFVPTRDVGCGMRDEG